MFGARILTNETAGSPCGAGSRAQWEGDAAER
jgi:hypothetical protein